LEERNLRKEENKNWYLIDAQRHVLGRMASKISKLLQGKHKPTYEPYLDKGDYVVVINAEKIILTGGKEKKKVYYYHSGYPGGLRKVSFLELLEKNPSKIIMLAVKGMLPHNKLGRAMLKKLKVYRGLQHPHQAQTPQLLAEIKCL